MSNRIEWRHLRYFLQVAEDLHFGQAARKLFISQPGLSRQIKKLEEELQTTLLERDNKNVELSRAGVYFKEEIELLLNDFERIITHTQLLSKGQEGRIAIGYVGSAMQNVIPDLLLNFRKSFPQINFGLKELDNAKQIQDLMSQKLDLGFVRLDTVPKDLSIKPVFEDTFSLVLPEDHSLTKRKFKSLDQVKEETFILFEKNYSPVYYENVMSVFETGGFEPIISHTSVHANTIFRLVENKFGISIVPSSLSLGYNMKVKFIELKNITQRTVLSVVWNKSNRNPVLKKVLDVVLKNMK